MCRSSRSRLSRAETCTMPQPEKAVSEAISSVQRLWFRGGISREATLDPLLFLIIGCLFATPATAVALRNPGVRTVLRVKAGMPA